MTKFNPFTKPEPEEPEAIKVGVSTLIKAYGIENVLQAMIEHCEDARDEAVKLAKSDVADEWNEWVLFLAGDAEDAEGTTPT